jgi:hypothetical protein
VKLRGIRLWSLFAVWVAVDSRRIAKALISAFVVTATVLPSRAKEGAETIFGRLARRFRAKPCKKVVDDQAASPSSWKTPRIAPWMV